MCIRRVLTAYGDCAQLVSHDFRLIDQVAQEIWVCDKKKITIWKVRLSQLAQLKISVRVPSHTLKAWIRLRHRCALEHDGSKLTIDIHHGSQGDIRDYKKSLVKKMKL